LPEEWKEKRTDLAIAIALENPIGEADSTPVAAQDRRAMTHICLTNYFDCRIGAKLIEHSRGSVS
jgi:hypothetical protein